MLRYVREALIILCVYKKGSAMIYVIVLLAVISVIGAMSFKINEITRLYSSSFVDYNDLYNITAAYDYITYINEELNVEENYDTLINNKKIEFADKNITLSLDEANEIIVCTYILEGVNLNDVPDSGKIEVKLKYTTDNSKFIVYPLKDIY